MSRGLVKIGLLGGSAGAPRDVQSPLNELRTVTIWSKGGAIDAISFSHAVGDQDTPVEEGPWGRVSKSTPSHVITLGPREYVEEIRGTIGTYSGHEVVRSLQIITSLKTYPESGVYGNSSGTPFRIPVASGRIEGFFASTGWYLDAIGVYVRP